MPPCFYGNNLATSGAMENIKSYEKLVLDEMKAAWMCFVDFDGRNGTWKTGHERLIKAMELSQEYLDTVSDAKPTI